MTVGKVDEEEENAGCKRLRGRKISKQDLHSIGRRKTTAHMKTRRGEHRLQEAKGQKNRQEGLTWALGKEEEESTDEDIKRRMQVTKGRRAEKSARRLDMGIGSRRIA